MTEIYNYAFYKNETITEVSLNDNLIKVGEKAFSECLLLEKIYIPSSVKEFGNDICLNSFKVFIYTSLDNLEYLKSIVNKLNININKILVSE